MLKQLLLIFSFAFITLSGHQAFAQSNATDSIQNATPEKLAGMQGNYLKDKLTLTPEQYTKVVDLYKKYNKKADETMKSNLLVTSKVQMIRETNTDKEAQLQKMVTADQWKQFQEIRTEFTQRYKQRITMR